MMINAQIIEHSVGYDAPELVTVALTYPRMIHGELMTHRRFSRNAASSRAIPFDRMVRDIEANMAFPAEWRLEEPGMQGWTKASDELARQGEQIVREGFLHARETAQRLHDLGFHKQHVNRYLEPYQYMRTLVTASLTKNFFVLRDHGDADPTFAAVARAWAAAMETSTPRRLLQGEWHLPYITKEDDGAIGAFIVNTSREELLALGFAPADVELMKGSELPISQHILLPIKMQVSSARCARVSYVGHDGKPTSIKADIKLYQRLVGSQPLHASPTEHIASPDNWLVRNQRWMTPERHGNLWGWLQYRKFLPGEDADFS